MSATATQPAGKVIIVTGGARGLGAAFGRHIVSRGGKVVLADLLDDDGNRLAGELGSRPASCIWT